MKKKIIVISRFIVNHFIMVIIKLMKNLFDVEMFIENKPNVQHVYHLKLNNNYYRMKMINKIINKIIRQHYHHHHRRRNNNINMALLQDILNNPHHHHRHHQYLDHKHYNHMVAFVHHIIHINLMVLHQLNKITMVIFLLLYLIMQYNHGQMYLP